MNFSKIQKLTKPYTVLLAPLDWGLGHATRCIPIINQLLKLNCKVMIAASGAQKKILSEAFPELEILFLDGYKIKYSESKRYFLLKLLAQFPKILRTIYKEHHWLKKVASEYKIAAVISDNRFGLYHSTLPCIYLTHQVAVKTGVVFLDVLASKLHLQIINRFSMCWIPDFEPETQSIAGQLSHPPIMPQSATYIGGLSRFEGSGQQPKLFDIVAVVSGPEPQRTLFEKQLLNSFTNQKRKILLIRGLPSREDDSSDLETEYLTIRNHLNQQALNQAMMQANVVVCRSGYTTIMDLLKIRQRAILIPTPGQAEQEYLAKHLFESGVFYTVAQQDFQLEKDLQRAASFASSFPDLDMNLYQQVVAQFVQSL